MGKRYPFRLTSGLLALLIGLSFGFYVSNIISAMFGIALSSPFDLSYWSWIIMGLFVFLFIYWDFKHPKSIEAFGFVYSSFIILQSFFWDFPMRDINELRITMFISSIFLLTLNMFTGYLRWESAVKTFRRAIGFKN